MKIKIKLSLMVIAIVAAIVGSIVVILLRQASDISLSLSVKSLRNFTGQRAQFWQGRGNGHLQMLRAVASIMAEYETLPSEERRDRYDYILRAVLEGNTDFVRIFSV